MKCLHAHYANHLGGGDDIVRAGGMPAALAQTGLQVLQGALIVHGDGGQDTLALSAWDSGANADVGQVGDLQNGHLTGLGMGGDAGPQPIHGVGSSV